MSIVNKNALDTKADELRKTLGEIELGVISQGYTFADAIREGSTTTKQLVGGWSDPSCSHVCAISAGVLAARARGIIK